MAPGYTLACLLAVISLAQAQAADQACPSPPSGIQRPWLDARINAQCRTQYVLDALGSIDRKLELIESNGMGPPQPGRRDPWRELGLFALRGNDGPAGNARAQHVTAVPDPLTVAASFDPAVAIEYGAIIGEEFHATGNSEMIGPSMDIARTWHFGRTPESFGEDPFLAASLTGPEVLAIQRNHIVVTIKHYAAYTQEQGRTGDPPFGENPAVNVLLSEQALREVYLAPFRAAVEVGRAGSVMCAFPRINGIYACEDEMTLGILKNEWGFDGAVVPDFPDAQRSVVSAINAGLDSGRFVEGPKPPPGAAGLAALFSGDLPGHDIDLPTAIRQGKISEARVDDLVRRRLSPAFRLGVYENPPTGDPSSDVSTPEHRQAAREIVSRGAVLLKNRSGMLPLDARVKRLVVIGVQAGATATVTMLGSGHVEPTHLGTAIDEIRERAGTSVDVSYAAGTLGIGALPRAPGSLFKTPDGADRPLAQYFANRQLDFSGAPLQVRVEDGATLNGSPAGITNLPPNYAYSVRWRGSYTASKSGVQRFSIDGCGSGKLLIDGKVAAEFQRVDFGAIEHAAIHMTAGSTVSVEIQWTPGQGAPGPAMHMLGTTLGTLFELGFAGPDSLMSDAVRAAAEADVAIVFAANGMGEGADRLHLNLPGDQDALIAAVAKANPRTIVVLNTGGAVMMPWLERVAAVLEMWYPGDAMGAGAADLLFGDTEPSGRLPLTFPSSESQGPGSTPATYPGSVDGAGMLATVNYSEGSNVGHRYFESHKQQPLFPFGFGLSYTSFKWSGMRVRAEADGGATVTTTVENIGARRGHDTVEVYALMPDENLRQPVKQLKGFATVELQPGEGRTVQIKLSAAEFKRWSQTEHAWRTATGNWQIMIGRSSSDIVYRQSLYRDEPNTMHSRQ
jgi:beta-glucosidase